MAEQWSSITNGANSVDEWERKLALMRAEQLRLREQGLWRSGGRTLMWALGLHHDEVMLCRGLAWLLTPDGWHGLGSAALNGLLHEVGLRTEGSVDAVVAVEEYRGDTRADLVVRFEGVTVLIEAKVWANEQEDQADRLAEGWSEEKPYLVFLTRDGRSPTTACKSQGQWQPVTWTAIGRLLKSAMAKRPECEPGVAEYIRTLEIYGGNNQ